ncbi:DsbA family protein [Natronobiforma cellulositropha]|uniref:DsbA family protein n=1 Tax=Natronobiforma cellulositropha TaxID=1679076 RepID=UPI0021D59A20|nr:DsbA family protein [Natronobiforma cellulositropha]
MSTTLVGFTDPFCTWSWGAEPVIRRTRAIYGDQIDLEFVMGGLVEDFETFHDGANGISDPVDVAPHWEEAARRHGMPVDANVWYENPPNSSYPASIAYKAAGFQEEALANRYLRRLREAFAAERRQIDQPEVLLELAEDVGLDVEQFETDLHSAQAREAFSQDMKRTRRNRATAFPSFVVENGDDRQLLRGFQSFDSIAQALERVDPSLEQREPPALVDFVDSHSRVATREVAELYELDREGALERLESLEADGQLTSRERGSGHFWKTT